MSVISQRGWVDIQVNGYMGVSYTSWELTLDQIAQCNTQLLESGTSGYLATITTTSPETVERNVALLAKAMGQPGIKGHLLGIHLEGPWLSEKPGAIGAHPPEYACDPTVEQFERFQSAARGNVRLVTVAPERTGALDVIRHMRKSGVAVGLGHSLADAQTIHQAIEAGAQVATHLGNGLPQDINRHHNPLWPQLAANDYSIGMITDGVHLTDDMIQTFWRAKGVANIIITADSSSWAGMPEGRYTGIDAKSDVIIEGNVIRCADRPGFAGSWANMSMCMDYFQQVTGATDKELDQVGRRNPLALIDPGLTA